MPTQTTTSEDWFSIINGAAIQWAGILRGNTQGTPAVSVTAPGTRIAFDQGTLILIAAVVAVVVLTKK